MPPLVSQKLDQDIHQNPFFTLSVHLGPDSLPAALPPTPTPSSPLPVPSVSEEPTDPSPATPSEPSPSASMPVPTSTSDGDASTTASATLSSPVDSSSIESSGTPSPSPTGPAVDPSSIQDSDTASPTDTSTALPTDLSTLGQTMSTSDPPPTSSASSDSDALPQPTSLQALSSHHSSRAGPIAGGVIGGLLILAALLLLLVYRKRLTRRFRGGHRVAPSAEFLHPSSRALSPRDGTFAGAGAGRFTPQQRAMSMHEGSRAASPYVVQRLGSSLSMHGNHEEGMTGMAGMAGVGAGTLAGLAAVSEGGIPPDEPPPPFSRGNFNDPLVEKLSDAARQREELRLYRAAADASPEFQQDLESAPFASSPTPLTMTMTMPLPAPYVSEDSGSSAASHGRQDSSTTGTSHQELFSKSGYVDPFHESDEEEDMRNTSPMLHPNKVSRLSVQVDRKADPRTRTKSQAGEIGWAV